MLITATERLNRCVFVHHSPVESELAHNSWKRDQIASGLTDENPGITSDRGKQNNQRKRRGNTNRCKYFRKQVCGRDLAQLIEDGAHDLHRPIAS
jgi:hypothetical protein